MASEANYSCANCGAIAAYDPPSGMLKCTACGGTQSITVDGEVTDHSLADFVRDGQGLTKLSAAALEVSCSSCGATVNFEPPQIAGECPFCATKIIMQPKAADPLIAPGAVLPFALDHRQSHERISSWISSRWFAPSALKSLATLDRVKGIYLPHWTYSAFTRTGYAGERGDRYTETEWVRNPQGQMVARQVIRVRWTPARGVVDVPFRDLIVAATQSIDRQRLEELTPWDLERLVPYQPAYLAGFHAQRYQMSLPDGFTAAQQRMVPVIDSAIRRDIGGDEQRIHQRDTHYYNVSFKHLLLPVWLGAYRFQGRVFQVCVNARTGEVQGERPYSWVKIVLTILAVLFGIWILALLGGGGD